MGADCLGDVPDDPEKACEAVCDAEDACHAQDATIGRAKADCVAALCTGTGFKTVDTGANASDLSTLTSNDCESQATDCGALMKCSCPDSCAREDQCTGNPDASCVDTCDNLIENDTSLYLQNRCKMESACADLAACGSSGQ